MQLPCLRWSCLLCYLISYFHWTTSFAFQPTTLILRKDGSGLSTSIPHIFNRRKVATSCRQQRVARSSSRSSENDMSDKTKISSEQHLLGTLVLLTVPLSWGTYVPVVRFLYAIQPPVPGFVFSACYYTLAAVTTSVLASMQSRSLPAKGLENNTVVEIEEESPVALQGGIELGLYLFVANCLQVIGLQTVESDRAGFLVQLTTVMVPLAEALSAGKLSTISFRTWVACIVAFLGICVMGLDGKENVIDLRNPDIGAALSFTQGDFFIIGAAVLYTLHVVRLGTYARETTAMKLAASKATVETVLSIGLISLLVVLSTLNNKGQIGGSESTNLLIIAAETGREITNFFTSFSKGVSEGSLPTQALLSGIGAVLWTGWVTSAYTIWAQSFGQARISPTNANLIYTFQPICTALVAWLLLGETMGPAGFLGGAIIASAVYAVASENVSFEIDTSTVERIADQSFVSSDVILDAQANKDNRKEWQPVPEITNIGNNETISS